MKKGFETAMKFWKTVIHLADHLVNLMILLCFLPIFLYGLYVQWDVKQVLEKADASQYEIYKPTPTEQSPAVDELPSHAFHRLKTINPEVFGWLSVDGTHIDYPLVQAKDNQKYLNLDVQQNFSAAGSIFLDCNNKTDLSQLNNILYGHHMKKDTMFTDLDLFADQEFFEKHRYGKIYTNGKWYDIEFFAFLHTDAYDSLLYNTSLTGQQGQKEYLNYLKENARYFKNLDFDFEERYLGLSTCTSSNTDKREVLVGRIVGGTEADKGSA